MLPLGLCCELVAGKGAQPWSFWIPPRPSSQVPPMLMCYAYVPPHSKPLELPARGAHRQGHRVGSQRHGAETTCSESKAELPIPPLVHCQLPRQNQSSSCLPLLCTLNRCACWSSPGNNVLIFAVHDFLLRGADCSESGHAGLHSTTGLDCKGKAWRQSLQDISALVRQLLRVGILGRCRMTAACHEQVVRRGDWNFTQALSISNCHLSAGHLGHS